MNAPHESLPPAEPQSGRLRADLEPTTRAVAGAHLGQLRAALDADGWERRGLLGRLTRVSRADLHDR